MTRSNPLSACLLATVFAALTGCTATAPVERSVYVLDIVGDDVSLSSTPLSLGDFLKVAQEITGEVYTFDSREAAAVGRIAFQGTIRCSRAEFGQFVQTMLYVKGLAVEVVEDGPLRVNLVRRI